MARKAKQTKKASKQTHTAAAVSALEWEMGRSKYTKQKLTVYLLKKTALKTRNRCIEDGSFNG